NFRATLTHNAMFYGKYSEDQDGDVVSVTFSSEKGEHRGTIKGDVLTVPDAWGDACCGGLDFKKK
ncbi:MAG: hypothetical protein FWD19_05670, partial [Defluviitaleaceae bacterium]|nr:hypothetical protein [Defluviitaleaceae bacterium]